MSSDQRIDSALKIATQAVRDLLAKGDILSHGLTHNEVHTLQSHLDRLGFKTEADGGFGAGTAKSVMDFLTQRSQREFVTQISPHMFRSLNEHGQKSGLNDLMAERVHKLISAEGALSKDHILQLQRGLEYATGEDLGTPDGVVGKQTREVLLNFVQRYDRGLIGAGSGGHVMLEMNGNLLIGAEDDVIERFVDQAESIPHKERFAFLHEHAEDILKGDARRGGHDDGLIAQGQLMLRSLGYAAGSVDGLIGGDRSKTRQALQQFLQDNPAPAPDMRMMAKTEPDGMRGEFGRSVEGTQIAVAEPKPEATPAPELPAFVRTIV